MPDHITFLPLAVALLTVSDSRGPSEDRSGDVLAERIQQAGHDLAERTWITDDIYQIRAVVSAWIAKPTIDVVLITGGTGITGRDGTPEAVTPLLDKILPGFGEMFRMLSYPDIGSAALQSRALLGVANGTYLFCLPGSTGACQDAWDRLIQSQLDRRTTPCNLVTLKARLTESAPPS